MSQLEGLLKLLPLDRLPRTGWILAGVEPVETVAAHSLGTAFVALALAPSVQPALDVDRAVTLAVLHDSPEALLTDLPKAAAALLPPGVKAGAEALAAETLLAPLSPVAVAREAEYRAQGTREARFVRLCDKLQLGVRLLGYVRAGARGLDDFRAGLAALDGGEFPPCEALRLQLLGALTEHGCGPPEGSPLG